MTAPECLRIYYQISAAINRRPRENLYAAAERYRRFGRRGVRKQVAQIVLTVGDKRGLEAWQVLASAASLVDPQITWN